jgi:hypothetical protein
MKTKIIYISGNELFDIADIRSAFEEVRSALSLGSDTVLFGVPVDNDDAFINDQTTQNSVEPVTGINEQPIETVVNDVPKKSSKIVPILRATEKKSPKKTVEEPIKEIEEVQEFETAEPIESDDKVVDTPDTNNTDTDDHVIPILSVLGSKSDNADTQNSESDVIESNNSEPVIDGIDDNVSNVEITESETVTISDIIADDVPDEKPEKTLEELLETMTPLGEDAEKISENIDIPENTDSGANTNNNNSDEDTDLTLEKLATEFFENQDKIGTPEKTASRGKIGKLKNILPFKKAKHDDSGLMGDLFGWAGVAANDDDFTIPGFFK